MCKVCFFRTAFSCLKYGLVSFEIHVYSGEIEKLMTVNPSETINIYLLENQFGSHDVFFFFFFLSKLILLEVGPFTILSDVCRRTEGELPEFPYGKNGCKITLLHLP